MSAIKESLIGGNRKNENLSKELKTNNFKIETNAFTMIQNKFYIYAI